VRTVFVGTYTHLDSQGLYRFEMDESGRLDCRGLVASARNPSFVTLDAARRRLFAVEELADASGTSGGAVLAYRVDPGGDLFLVNRRPTFGSKPCHVAAHPSGRVVLVANYGSGSVTVHRVEPEGGLSPPTDLAQHRGGRPDTTRQSRPHPHAIHLTTDGRWALVPDLGLDAVLVYKVDADAGTLRRHKASKAEASLGAGPRHGAFHPSGRLFYTVNELDSTVTVFRCSKASLPEQAIQTISTIPETWHGDNLGAEIVVEPTGRFLYASNRGHDSIAIFAIDSDDGTLLPAGHVSAGGRGPRHFAIDPSGTFLLVANQDSDNLAVFRFNAATGALVPVGTGGCVPTPVCVVCDRAQP
jgi:6-phosphogluconolactonase